MTPAESLMEVSDNWRDTVRDIYDLLHLAGDGPSRSYLITFIEERHPSYFGASPAPAADAPGFV